jgi:hypothetical protein
VASILPAANRHPVRSAVFGFLPMTLGFVASWNTSGANPSSPPQTVGSFLRLAARGISGTFSELYQISQGPLSGTVDLAQEGPPGQLPLTKCSGRWSFDYQSKTGPSMQWNERGSCAWDCIHDRGAARWTCSGPGQFEDSNGFFISITPYIPGVVLNDIAEVTNGLETYQALGITFSTSTCSRFGSLRCMEVLSTPSCLDRAVCW